MAEGISATVAPTAISAAQVPSFPELEEAIVITTMTAPGPAMKPVRLVLRQHPEEEAPNERIDEQHQRDDRLQVRSRKLTLARS